MSNGINEIVWRVVNCFTTTRNAGNTNATGKFWKEVVFCVEQYVAASCKYHSADEFDVCAVTSVCIRPRHCETLSDTVLFRANQ